MMIKKLIEKLQALGDSFDVERISCDQEMLMFALKRQLNQEEVDALPSGFEYTCGLDTATGKTFPNIVIFPCLLL
jgi:hypothetical protein